MFKVLHYFTAVIAMTVASGAFAAGAVNAGIPRPANRQMQITVNKPAVQNNIPGKFDTQALDESVYETIDDWQAIGNGRYSDGFVAWSVGDTGYEMDPWAVEVEESESHPGLFRLKNPYANCTYATQYDEVDLTQDYYMIVDATNAAEVYVPLFDTGVNPYGAGECYGMSDVSAGYGTYNADTKIISFPAFGLKSRLGTNGSWNSCNNDKNCVIYLPGAIDYTAKFTAGAMCGTENATASVKTGADIAYVTAAFATYGNATEFERKELTEGSLDLSYAMESHGKYQMIVKYYNESDSLIKTISATFFRIEDQNDQWESLGTTSMTEPFFNSFFGSGYAPTTYDVELQENIATPGFYRVVNPIANYSGSLVSYNKHSLTSHNHYIYIHAENPEQVYVEESPLGFEMEGYGDLALTPTAGQYGTIENGVITIPSSAAGLWFRDYYNGFTVSLSSAFTVTVPMEHTITVKSANESAGTVAITDPATEGTTITTRSSSVTITATPAENAKFLFWTDGSGENVSTDATYVFNGSVDAEFTAHFGYDVVLNIGTGGSATVTPGGADVVSGKAYEAGSVIEIKPASNPTYELKAVSLNGEPLTGVDGTYTFTVSGPSEVEVAFNPLIYTLTILVEGNGTVECWTYDDGNLPGGTQVNTGEDMPHGKALCFYLMPGDGESVETFTYQIGEDEAVSVNTNPEDGEIWEVDYKNAFEFDMTEDQILADVVVSVNFTGENQGIDEIGMDPANGSVEYYNLQGVRVAAENLAPGFYIIRQGSKAVKVFITK